MEENNEHEIVPPVCVAVDVQNDFITGSLGSEWAAEVAPNIVDFCRKAMELYNARLICTKDTHGINYTDTREGKVLPVSHCIGGSEGWELYDGMDFPRAYDVEKYTFMSDPQEMGRALQDRLGISGCNVFHHKGNVFVYGFCTSICVVANALLLRGLMPEANIMVVADLCADIDGESHAAALRVMANNHIPSVSADEALEMLREQDAAGGELS